jgi:hypothetical protein
MNDKVLYLLTSIEDPFPVEFTGRGWKLSLKDGFSE